IAFQLFDQAVALASALEQGDPSGESSNLRARALMNKGTVQREAGDLGGALASLNEAAGLYEGLLARLGRAELAVDLAMTYRDRSSALGDLEGDGESVADCDRAIAIAERLVLEEGRLDLRPLLAKALMNRAILLASSADLAGALAPYDRAIELYGGMVRDGRA